jgi:hypothetical protein
MDKVWRSILEDLEKGHGFPFWVNLQDVGF